MHALVRDTLSLLRQEFSPGDSIVVSQEELAFFQMSVKKEKPAEDPMQDLRKALAKTAPFFRLKEEVLDDSAAQKASNLWQEDLISSEVLLLNFGQNSRHLAFLQNVAKAVSSLLAPAKIIDARAIEKDSAWEVILGSNSLKVVIAPAFELWKGSKLSGLYRENPSSGTFSLQGKSLLLLDPIDTYFKNPDSKKRLWQSLVSQLSS